MAQITLNSTGVASDGALVLQSNGTTTAVTIDTSQNVGIGTSSPQTNLEVASSVGATLRLTSTDTTISAADELLGGIETYSNDSSVEGTGISSFIRAYSSKIFNGDGRPTYLSFGTSNFGAGPYTPQERLRIDSAGNVGIGTSAPNLPLTVAYSDATAIPTGAMASETTGAVQVFNTSDSAAYSGIYLRTRTTSSTAAMIGLRYNTSFTDGDIFFRIRNNSNSSIEPLTIKASGNVGIGTSTPAAPLQVNGASGSVALIVGNTGDATQLEVTATTNVGATLDITDGGNNRNMMFAISGTERARITSGGDFLVGKNATTFSAAGSNINSTGKGVFTVDNDEVMLLNRLTSDGNLIRFYQASTEEGQISVSGTTVSYTGGHLSRWAQTTTVKDDLLVKGTVLSNLDAMNVYTDSEGNPVPNEQLNKVKVSDVEGDANVAGVFVNWTHDDAHNVDEINMAMTGDMIIRIAQGTTVQRGDLLMSAGDGTAKPQGDDIVRSKTVAKVTSTHVTCTYADGSYCVPCVLMAC
jgi:hypothetical protein